MTTQSNTAHGKQVEVRGPHYPDLRDINVERAAHIHNRWRVVIPCYNKEQADRIAEKVAEHCGGCIEGFIGVTDSAVTTIVGEALLYRKGFPLKDRVPMKPSGTPSPGDDPRDAPLQNPTEGTLH